MMNICSRFDVFCNIVAYNVNINSLLLCCILALQTTLQVCIVVSVLFNALCKMLMASWDNSVTFLMPNNNVHCLSNRLCEDAVKLEFHVNILISDDICDKSYWLTLWRKTLLIINQIKFEIFWHVSYVVDINVKYHLHHTNWTELRSVHL